MDHRAFDKHLQSLKIGNRIIGSGNLLFDREYEIVDFAQFEKANLFARQQLAFYFERKSFSDASDCDTFHLIWLGRIKEYFLKHDPLAKATFNIGMAWGVYNGYAHAWGIYVGSEGLIHCNYCNIETPQSFEAKGSIYV